MVAITENEFCQLSNYIRNNYGIYLKEEKKKLFAGMLQNVLSEKNFKNFSDYYKYLITDKTGKAVTALLDRITINYTFFMREVDHFYYFRDKVLPLLVTAVKEKDLRIWSAACSSGEEAYTLAMIIDEFFGREKKNWDTRVLATDISERVLNVAKNGIYIKDRIDPLPVNWKLNYFSHYNAENVILNDKIKKEVIYRKFNLMESEFPFKKKFHTIFCKNVMLYFDHQTNEELVNKLYDQLEDGGYLFIGHSESLNRDNSRFKYIMPSVYQKQ